jgi:hypothetical protein
MVGLMDNKKLQTYNDGTLNVYSVSNEADSGDRPIKKLTLKVGFLRYEERTVGVTRLLVASNENSRIEQLLRIPRLDFVNSGDAIIPNDGKPYEINKIQYPKDVLPPSMDLSLVRLEGTYEFAVD